VLLLVALLMTVLLVMVAIVVDLGNARQQQTHAQAIADAAALSGVGAISDNGGNGTLEAFKYAFLSLSLPPPAAGQPTSCGSHCQTYTAGGATVTVSDVWEGDPANLHVQVCWNVPQLFSGVSKSPSSRAECGAATGHNSSSGGGGAGNVAAYCQTNELTNTVSNPINAGAGTLLSATYNGGTFPLDPSTIVFIAPDSAGTLGPVALSPVPNDPTQGYTLNPPIGGTTVTIQYRLPAGLSTSSASLFVQDVLGNSCGQAAWSSCNVASGDAFFEVNAAKQAIADHGYNSTSEGGPDNDGDESPPLSAAAQANSVLVADADDDVIPAVGQQVTQGATLGATFHDENPIDPSRIALLLNGTKQTPTLSVGPPPNPTGDGTVPGQVSPTSSGFTDSQGHVTVTLTDYLGDPIAGRTVVLSNLSKNATATPATAATAQDGTAHFTVSSKSATFTVTDVTDNAIIAGPGAAPNLWTGIYGPNDTPGSPDQRAFYKNTISTVLPTLTRAGWNSAFLYVYDTDRNLAGGDCSLLQFAFRFQANVSLTQ
jgi:Flp pilus assembly protein TadG